MKRKHTVSLLIAIAAVACVAAAMAQQSQQQDPERRSRNSSSVSSTVGSTSRAVGSASADSASTSTDPATNTSTDVFFAPLQRSGASFGAGSRYTALTYGDPLLGGLGHEEAQLAHEAGELVQKLESTDSESDRSDIKVKLTANLGKQFDSRQKRHGEEIKALEAKVKKLKDLVSKRQESREEIISRRLEQILRDSQGLGW
jgi:hypothetical protein